MPSDQPTHNWNTCSTYPCENASGESALIYAFKIAKESDEISQKSDRYVLRSLTLSLPALAGVTVNSPSNDTDVSSPFNLSAPQRPARRPMSTAMGYSSTSSSDTTVVNSQSINKSVSSSTGTHTLHVKAWGGTALRA